MAEMKTGKYKLLFIFTPAMIISVVIGVISVKSLHADKADPITPIYVTRINGVDTPYECEISRSQTRDQIAKELLESLPAGIIAGDQQGKHIAWQAEWIIHNGDTHKLILLYLNKNGDVTFALMNHQILASNGSLHLSTRTGDSGKDYEILKHAVDKYLHNVDNYLKYK